MNWMSLYGLRARIGRGSVGGRRKTPPGALMILVWLIAGMVLGEEAAEPVSQADLAQELQQLREENARMQELLRRQQEQIEGLQRRFETLEERSVDQEEDLGALSERVEREGHAVAAPRFKVNDVIIGGQGGVLFLHQDSGGPFDHADFRIDDAELFLDARIWEDTYFFSELTITRREETNTDLRVGEIYLEFEDVLERWGKEGWLTVRVGRMDIPFGEEYQRRDVVENPLITHSLPDFWGVDEGVEIFGGEGAWHYVMAVQNGGRPSLFDHHADKSVAGRIGYAPWDWLRTSLSGMRTGTLDVKGDKLSEMWFGNGFIRALGPAARTRTFWAEIVQGDVEVRWADWVWRASGGYLAYDDDDRGADNSRDVFFYSLEAVHDVTEKLYVASRFGQILAEDGFPVVGQGSFKERFFGPLTEDVWRWSLGVGYRWSPDLVFKVEYSMERGETVAGQRLDDADLIGMEIGYRF